MRGGQDDYDDEDDMDIVQADHKDEGAAAEVVDESQNSLAFYSSDDPEILKIIKDGLDFDDGMRHKEGDSTDWEDKDIF